jgi:RNA polymerase-binding protein DksA
MSESQMNEFKHQLQHQAKELRAEIKHELLNSQNAHYVDLAGRVHDTEDQSVADLLMDLKLVHHERHVQGLYAIENALTRIANKTYGLCSDCGEAIAQARLQIDPTVQRCQPCQTRYEEKHGAGLGPSL